MGLLATLLTLIGIAALILLDRSEKRVSLGNVVPLLWLTIASSRPVSSWGSAPSIDRNASYMEGSPLDRALLTFLIFLGVVVLLQRTGQVKAILRRNAAIIMFLSYCVISIVWAEFPMVLFKRWIRGVADVVMVLIVMTDDHPEAALMWIVSRVAYLLVPLSILFIRFYPELGRAYSLGGTPMWTGVCTDKNALGALCMLSGVAMLWRWMHTYSDRSDPDRSRHLFAIGTVFAMAVYLTSVVDSKTSQICFLLGLAVVLQRRILKRPTVIFLFIVSTVATCYAVLIGGVGGGALEAIGRDASLTGRTDVWDAVLKFVENPWIGAGYENFWLGEKLESLSRLGGNQAHNGYLEIYLNLGWVGLGFLAILVLAGYRSVVAGFRHPDDLNRLRLAFFVNCLIYNFSEAAFKMMSPVWLMFLWATMARPAAVTATADERERVPAAAPVLRNPYVLPVRTGVRTTS